MDVKNSNIDKMTIIKNLKHVYNQMIVTINTICLKNYNILYYYLLNNDDFLNILSISHKLNDSLMINNNIQLME